MKYSLSFLLALLLSAWSPTIFAQATLSIPDWHFINPSVIPKPTPDMPEYAKLLYADEVNLMELDSAYKAFYDQRGWEHQKEDLEHDAYAKFFKMWYDGARNFVDDNGMVKVMNTHDLLLLRKHYKALETQQNSQVTSRGVNSTWSFLGPKRTIWRADHKPSQPVAPWQANVYCIAVAPSNPSILFCGSETGEVYKTTDKGLNWTPLNQFNWGGAISSVAIHPTNPDIVYVGLKSDLVKSTDGGSTWNIVHTTTGLGCNAIAISPTTPETVLAATNKGLLRSTNSGSSWQIIDNKHFVDVKFRPNDGTTAYALAYSGNPSTYSFYKSTDGGTNFQLKMTDWPDVYEKSGGRICVTPANSDYVYAVLLTEDANNANQKPYVLKTTDQAEHWTTIATGAGNTFPLTNGQGYYDLDIVASHVNPDHLIVATITAFKTTDGGTSWTKVGGYGGDFAIHPDIQEMISIMDGSTENTWIATDGGTNFSTDFFSDTTHWEARIDGIDGSAFWGFSQGWNEDYIVGGRYHNGNTALYENYPDHRALRLGGAESVTGWAMHGRERYAAFNDIPNLIIPQNITDAPEGSFTFTKFPQNYYHGDAYSRVMVDLEDYMTAYLGEGSTFWRTKDGGVTWEALFTFPNGALPYHFDISRADPNYIYLATDKGFFRSTDRGETFTQMSLPGNLTNAQAGYLRIAASSSDKNKVWAVNQKSSAASSKGRVFVSTNGGNTWTDLTTPTIQGRKWAALAHQAGTNGGVYIASDRGITGTMPAKVMYRDATMDDWQDFSDGLPLSANPTKLLPFYRDGKLRWGGNRGAWEIDFYEENWTPIPQPFVNGKDKTCSRDTFRFDSYSVAKATATYAWSMPDATWTSGLNQRKAKALFPSGGPYTVTLTITQDGQTYSKSLDITVGSGCDAEPLPGNALNLSGNSSDYAKTIEAPNFSSNTVTFSAWIKRNGTQKNNAGIVFARGSSSAGLNFKNNNELGLHWNNSYGSWHSGFTVPDNEWTHVALVITPTQLTVYMNGVPSSRTGNYAPYDFNTEIIFGADPQKNNRRFKGDIDEVLFYNRALSQDEIRELMHLTREPDTESDLVSYWQFNENSGVATDRKGINHAVLLGAAARQSSDAPVGPGISQRLTVNSGGTYAFTNTDLSLTFANGANTYPDGELCVTRLDISPDVDATTYQTPSYWIVHNYGNNTSFDELTSLDFANVPVDADLEANPANASLYKRASNAHDVAWVKQDDADATTQAGGIISFSANNSQTSFSQFIIGYAQAPLPVELLDFKIRLNRKKQVDLIWNSETEIDFDHYEIQRSGDGRSFKNIQSVPAKGQTNQMQSYHAIDTHPLRGVSYYRLKIVDEDGEYTYSDSKSIVIDALAEKVILYPNPLKLGGTLHIQSATNEVINLKIMAMDGEETQIYRIKGKGKIIPKDLPPGAYGYLLSTSSWRQSGILIIKGDE